MLSRVAENFYWLGRYVERAEDTARLVSVNANLLLDLPRGVAPGWEPLIAISGGEALFHSSHKELTERAVLKFLIGDPSNPGSIIASLIAARENVRTIRDIVPREAWELINELYFHARDNLQSGLSKRGRYPYLKYIVFGTQTIAGQLSGTMNHDVGYQFLRIGRFLERGDMTSRIIDVRSANLLPAEAAELRPFDNIQWVSLLKSLTAYQMYRRSMQVRVRRWDVLRFLFQHEEFPRSIYYATDALERAISRLGHKEACLRLLGRIKRNLLGTDVAKLTQSELHEYIDGLQQGFGDVHQELYNSYFHNPLESTAAGLPEPAPSQRQSQTSLGR